MYSAAVQGKRKINGIHGSIESSQNGRGEIYDVDQADHKGGHRAYMYEARWEAVGKTFLLFSLSSQNVFKLFNQNLRNPSHQTEKPVFSKGLLAETLGRAIWVGIGFHLNFTVQISIFRNMLKFPEMCDLQVELRTAG